MLCESTLEPIQRLSSLSAVYQPRERHFLFLFAKQWHNVFSPRYTLFMQVMSRSTTVLNFPLQALTKESPCIPMEEPKPSSPAVYQQDCRRSSVMVVENRLNPNFITGGLVPRMWKRQDDNRTGHQRDKLFFYPPENRKRTSEHFLRGKKHLMSMLTDAKIQQYTDTQLLSAVKFHLGTLNPSNNGWFGSRRTAGRRSGAEQDGTLWKQFAKKHKCLC